jgi:hypothetical protein
MTNATLQAMEHQMVMGWKVREHGRPLTISASHDFVGLLMRGPTIGESMLIFNVGGEAMITSVVRQVSLQPDGALLVETINSTYRLVFGRPTEWSKAA